MTEVIPMPPSSDHPRRPSPDSPPPPPRRREPDRRRRSPRDRDNKRRMSKSPPPNWDRRGRGSPPFKRRRASPRGRISHVATRSLSRVMWLILSYVICIWFGYDRYEREQGGRFGYANKRAHGRFSDRSSGGYPNWNSGHGGYDGPSNTNPQREGLMSYKQFIQELEDDILPSEAERRYEEYKSEYISTQKQTFFDRHKDEEWLKNKYHPTNLITVIQRRNELAQKNAKEFLLDLQSGSLNVDPGLNNSSSSKPGQESNPNSDGEDDGNGKRRRHGRSQANLSAAPKAHPICSERRRVKVDIEQALALVRKLDSEKGIEENILSRSDNDGGSRDKSHSSSGPVVILRGLDSVRGLEGIELLDILITYLWRIHGVDYYGSIEKTEPKGLRHVRIDGKSYEESSNVTEWEKKLDTHWQERLGGDDPLELMSAKEKIEGAAIEALDPHVRKIRDEKYGWKYGCGAKGCTKLFHAPEFVQKHLRLKHPDLVAELTSKLTEDLYLQNYMDDEDAPGGTPAIQPSMPRESPMHRRPMESRLRDDRGVQREIDNDDSAGGNGDNLMFDSFGGQGMHVALPFPSEIDPPPVLMPVPGAGPLGPFVPAPPEVARRMMREQGGPPPFEGSGIPRPGPAPIIALPPGMRQDPRHLRSYQDLDAPDEEVTVIDYRSL